MESKVLVGVLALAFLATLTARGEIIKGVMSVTGAEMD